VTQQFWGSGLLGIFVNGRLVPRARLRSDKGRANRNKAEAMREAELTLLKDVRYRHPFYWADFVMIGNGM
jgi:hypothetical protein